MRRSAIAAAVAAAAAAAAAAAFHAAHANAAVVTASWVGTGGGTWTQATRWSTNPTVPNNGTPAGAMYEAVIDQPGTYAVRLFSTVAVDSLTLNAAGATLLQSAGTLTLPSLSLSSGTYQLTGGTLSGGTAGGTVSLSPGAKFRANGGTLDRLTFTGGDLAANGVSLNVTNGLNLSGNRLTVAGSRVNFDGASQMFDDTISGSGSIYAGGPTSAGSVTLTLGTHSTVSGAFSIHSYGTAGDPVINNGALSASGPGKSLTVAPSAFTNNGTAAVASGATLAITATTWTNPLGGSVTADASTLTLGGSWSSPGAITATHASTVNLDGSFASGNLANFSASADSTVNLTGTLYNSGTLTLSTANHPWNLAGGTISGGTLNFGSNLNIVNGTFTGVTIPAGNTIGVPAGASLTLSGNFSNQGAVTTAAGATLTLAGNFVTPSIGTVTPAPGAPVNIVGNLTNTGATLSLPFTPNLVGQGRIVNGTVASDLYINGGQLFGTTIAPSATITAAGALFYGNWSNHGTVAVPAGGSLSLSGPFSTAAIGNVSAAPTGTVYISGALDNTGATLNNPSGHWILNSGTITGGTIGSDLAVTYGTFTNTSVAPGATLSSSYSQDAWFNGSWTNAGTITADSSIYNLNGTWSNTGTLSFSNSAATTNTGADLQGTWSNTGTLSVSNLAFVTLMGNWNNTGLISLSNHGNLTLTGTITPAQLGRITATPDSTLTITGSLVMTPAETFSTTGNLRIDIGSVTGGTIALAPGQSINVAPAATFNGVRITGGDITTTPDISSGGAVTFTNGLDLGGHAVNVNNNSSIGFNGTQTVDHTTINLRGGGHACGLFSNTYNPGDAITFGPDATVTTVAYASISGGAIVNNGAIRAQAITAAPTLQINNTSLVNNNRLEAVNGAKIQISAATTLTNTGTISISGPGATLDLQSTNWSNAAGATLSAGPGTTLLLHNGHNAGSISLDNATATLSGLPLVNTGVISLHNATINAPGGLAVGAGTLTGSGIINGNLTCDPDPTTLLFHPGTDQLVVHGDVTLAGLLQLSLTDTPPAEISPTDSFVLLTLDPANTLSGSFLNAPDGDRLLTTDGLGSFLIHYGGSGTCSHQLVLTDFIPVPEPTNLLVTLPLLLSTLRRRRNC